LPKLGPCCIVASGVAAPVRPHGVVMPAALNASRIVIRKSVLVPLLLLRSMNA